MLAEIANTQKAKSILLYSSLLLPALIRGGKIYSLQSGADNCG
ncbi:MAG: hypothetical protein WBA89_05900 [Microcoleus sp.]